MSRIKLKSLLNLTEQAPQPSLGDLGGTPVPAALPPSGVNAGQPPETSTPAPVDTQPTSPEPEDPSEYDFTRDFRAFEDKKNKAESDAKKILLDKMNKRLLSKTIVANASRGYGQPKTDYTISNVKKISVEFWYKDYVVIATDDKDKKYFLTPGINVKIEGNGSQPAPDSNQTGSEENNQIPQDNASPSPESPETDGGNEPQTVGQPATQGTEVPNQQTPVAPVPDQNTQPTVPGQPNPEQPDDEDPTKPKKKSLPVAEFLQRDLNLFLLEFMIDDVKNENGKINFLPYISEASRVLSENIGSSTYKCKLFIPENHMVRNVDVRDIRLSAIDKTQKNACGQYSKGSVDISRNGRYYLLEYVKETGWNI